MPEKRPVKLQVVELPYLTDIEFDKMPTLSCSGVLIRLVYDDGTYDFIENPWFECDKRIGEYPGIYKVRVYVDENHKYGLYTTFKFRIEDMHIIEKMIKSEI